MISPEDKDTLLRTAQAAGVSNMRESALARAVLVLLERADRAEADAPSARPAPPSMPPPPPAPEVRESLSGGSKRR